jgi:hypothetical protein
MPEAPERRRLGIERTGALQWTVVICPLCRKRPARRACPAVGQQICSICCGTKRLVEIACPDDCPYLASAREHPPARVARKQEDDLTSIVRHMRDLDERQAQLFFLVLTFLARYATTEGATSGLVDTGLGMPGPGTLVDEDVREAFTALAATYETASRGLVYEQRPQSLPADRFAQSLQALFTEAGKRAGSAFDRDAGVVFRRLEEAVTQQSRRPAGEHDRRVFVDLVGRVVRAQAENQKPAPERKEPSRLILPG